MHRRAAYAAGAHPAGRRRAPASTPWSKSCVDWLGIVGRSIPSDPHALSRPDRHPREPRGARRLPRRRRRRGFDRTLVLGDLVGYGADPNAVIERVRALEPAGDRPRQSRQGGVRPRAGRRVQHRGAERAAHWTLDDADAGASRRGSPRCPKGRSPWTTLVEICHGSPFDEDAYIFDELDARARAEGVDASALPVRTHALPRDASSCRTDRSTALGAADVAETEIAAARRLEVPGESRVGRPAARRRPARGVRHRGRRSRSRVELFRVRLSDRDDAGEGDQGRACPTCSRSGSRVGSLRRGSTGPRPCLRAAFSSRRRSSAAYASRAARDPRIHPTTTPDEQDRRNEDEVAGRHRGRSAMPRAVRAPACRLRPCRAGARSSRGRTSRPARRTRRRQ